MKLEVWKEAIELVKLVNTIVRKVPDLEFKLRSQILDAVQSISANISEGCCRRSINEYLQFINVALGSTGELMTRMIGLKVIDRLSESDFETFDKAHYSVENKLLALKKSLQQKRKDGTWQEEL
ncbi:MAG: hypothetical protein A2X67_04305 [Ignavibacteria bacterium GWA2_55_11]|nr:MAG: hypothetical protein A2X67_04305 [Ignavibacteria bacterium GWA2_55_11]